jgi:transcriptional regulator with XRE-family HTH domain
MMKIERIRELLLDRRLAMVADATGIHYATIQAIRNGKVTNPSYETVRLLSEYLEDKNDAV